MHMELDKKGQVLGDESEPVVVGGMILDINATPSVPANPRTTTPGKVRYALGGVARNVAECMQKIGAKPFLISAVGFDLAGNLMLESWRSAGLSVEGIRKHKDIETAVVCNILDGEGELAGGVASVEAIERFLTPEWIQKFKFKFCAAPVLMVDANLSPPALVLSSRMAAECDTPVWFEPVSVTKSKRVAPIVKYVTFTSPNEDELVAMANALSSGNKFSALERNFLSSTYSTESLFQRLKPPIWVLLERGIQVVIVTLGSNGVFLCFKAMHGVDKHDFVKRKSFSSCRKLYETVNLSCPPSRTLNTSRPRGGYCMAIHFPAISASVVRLTGGGDCFVGGTIASLCSGLDIMQSVAVGIAAARGAVESESNVPAEYDLTKVAGDARSVYSDAKVVFCESKL
ncbi:pentatricopeptide repeat-containing protein mitochondrial-like [Dorcoceras hygrometricum]|nr:pentatricopeptide repeat-containing protein mitochondrial-like [Dorcoceras hygrometricum]